jgi:hypothetical protein
MNPDRTPLVSIIIANRRTSLSAARRNTKCPIRFAIPVLANPPLKIRTAQTVMTAGLLNPERASEGETKPVIARLARMNKPTRSTRTQLVIKRRIAAPKIINTRMMSSVIVMVVILKTLEIRYMLA